MKKIIFLIISFLLIGFVGNAQCTHTSQFGSATINAGGTLTTISTCSFGGEYSPISGAVSGQTLQFVSSVSTDYITIHSGSASGPVVAFGPTPLTFANTFTGTLYAHWSANISCGTSSSCRTTTVQCLSCISAPGPCTNTSSFGSAAINTGGGATTISTCSFAGEYSTITGAVAGQSLKFTSSVSTDFITIHSGTPSGPVLAFGTTPLTFANTFTGTLYAHWSTNSSCGTQSSCRTTTIECLSCTPAPAPVNDNCSGALVLNCGDTITGNNSTATDEIGLPFCGNSSAFKGVWYKITPTANSNITLAACGSTIDTYLRVYSGSCGSLSCVASNDDGCGLQSQLTFLGTAGTTYYILLSGFNAASFGAFTLSATCSVIASSCLDGTINAPGSVSGNTCGAGNDASLRTSEELIYKVTIPTAGCYNFSLCGSTPSWDSYIYLTTACSGTGGTPGGGTVLASNDDNCGFLSAINNVSLAAGDYYLTVEAFSSGCGAFTLNITTATVPTVGSIAGETSPNCNTSYIYSIPNTAGVTYTWSAVGGTITSGQGSSTATVLWGSGPTLGPITVVPSNTCGDGTSSTLNLTSACICTPALTCPSNIVVNNDFNQCGAIVSYVANDTNNCDATTIIYNPPSGSFFAIGTTEVTATATSASSSESSSCTFTVTVNDTQPPVISCPANIVVSNDANQCGANVSFAASASDNCGTANITYSPTSGSLFVTGTTIVTATADDSHGNTASCTFTVTVNDTQAPVITCAPSVVINNTTGLCTGTTTLTLPTVNDNCTNTNALGFDGLSNYVVSNMDVSETDYTAEMWFKTTNGDCGLYMVSVFNLGSDHDRHIYLSGGDIRVRTWTDETISTSGTNYADGNWHHVAHTLGAGGQKIYVDGILKASGVKSQSDFYWQNNIHIGISWDSPNPLFQGAIDEVRVWNVARTQAEIQANMNKELNSQPNLQAVFHFNQGVADGNNAGINTATDSSGNGYNGTLYNFDLNGSISNWTQGKVENVTITNDAPATFAIGNNTVNWTATDTAGNSATCTQTVTVNDTEAPSISCQGNITVSNTPGQCGANVTFAATATDNCGTANITYSTASGSFFATGTTSVTATADDGHGNTASCTFTVTVNDTQGPSITCATPIVVQCPGDVVLVPPTVSDNCSLGVIYGPELSANGDFSSGGTNWDQCGNNVEAYAAETSYGGSNPFNTVAEVDHEPVTLCQSISGFVVGQTYQLSFKASRRDYAPSTVGADITIDGGALNTTVTRSNTSFSLTPETFTFVATQTTHQLTFLPSSGWYGTVGFIVDDITIKKVSTIDNNAPANFPYGTTTVTWSAIDSSGNLSSCYQAVSVIDTFTPVMNCPSNIVVTNTPGQCNTSVSWVAPTATDNCVVQSLVSNYAPGDDFPIGTTTVTYTATDGYGNSTSCSFNVTVNIGDIYYADSDGDGYGNPNISQVVCSQPAGYVTDNTDCNDANAAIHPGILDIPYDSIDNNCDGSLFDGHAPVVVYVLSPSCGGINHGLNNTINCTDIYLGPGYVIGYRFKVTNLLTGEVAYVDTVQHNFKLTDTNIYAYGTPYSIQVAAIVNGEVQPFNGPTCTLTTTTVATTKVIASQCGSTLVFMTSTINATAVNQAIAYRFRVARADMPGVYYYSTERTLPNFNLTQLTVPNGFLTYATEYKVDVQIKVKLANIIAWSQFGQVCSIFTPAMPETALVAGQCETIATSNTQQFNTTPYAGVSLYRFRLTLFDLQNNLIYSQYVDTPNPYFTLSMFTGLLPGTTYTVSVSMKLYGSYVDYGKDCSVTTPLVARTMEIPFKAVAHPNPFAENFMINVTTSSQEVVSLKVYDMIGRLVEQREVKVADLENSPIGDRYPSGVYNIIVTQGEEVRTVRVVKR